MTLGEKIHNHRKLRGMSQEELASQITVSRQAVSKWELGESVPDTENVVQLSKLFGVSADYLLNDDIETDMDISVVHENSDKQKRKYNLIILYAVIGTFLGVLICIGILLNQKPAILFGVLFAVFFGLGVMITKAVRKKMK